MVHKVREHDFSVDPLPKGLYHRLREYQVRAKRSRWKIVVEALTEYLDRKEGNLLAPSPVSTVPDPSTPTPSSPKTWSAIDGKRMQVVPWLEALLQPGDLLDEAFGETVLIRRAGQTLSLSRRIDAAQEPDPNSSGDGGTNRPYYLGG